MKDLVNQTKNQIGQQQANLKEAEPIINRVFIGLKRAFPAWRHHIRSEEEESGIKKEWIKAFQQHGINTQEQIANGFKYARLHDSPYFPSVGMFIKWCNTKDACKHASHEIYLPPPKMTDEEQKRSQEAIRRIKEGL